MHDKYRIDTPIGSQLALVLSMANPCFSKQSADIRMGIRRDGENKLAFIKNLHFTVEQFDLHEETLAGKETTVRLEQPLSPMTLREMSSWCGVDAGLMTD